MGHSKELTNENGGFHVGTRAIFAAGMKDPVRPDLDIAARILKETPARESQSAAPVVGRLQLLTHSGMTIDQNRSRSRL